MIDYNYKGGVAMTTIVEVRKYNFKIELLDDLECLLKREAVGIAPGIREGVGQLAEKLNTLECWVTTTQDKSLMSPVPKENITETMFVDIGFMGAYAVGANGVMKPIVEVIILRK